MCESIIYGAVTLAILVKLFNHFLPIKQKISYKNLFQQRLCKKNFILVFA